MIQRMTTPRCELVDPEVPLFYHLISRCVRRAWLCGVDPYTGGNYEHRKEWLLQRLYHLASCYAVDVYAYTVLSNHFHLVVHYDPLSANSWSNQEVAERWLKATRPPEMGDYEPFAYAMKLDNLLADAQALNKARKTLGSLSDFMKNLKQPIALRANREDECTGHFFEGRFYSGALLDEEAVIAAMAYVDLNPVRAQIVESATEASYTSAAVRSKNLINRQDRIEEYLEPIVSGIPKDEAKPPKLPITTERYLEYLDLLSGNNVPTDDTEKKWYERVAMFEKKQRAYGSAESLDNWAQRKGWSRAGTGLLSL